MHAGLCLLRLSPADFWALTPLELHVMTGGFKASDGAAMAREGLDALMRRYPDG